MSVVATINSYRVLLVDFDDIIVNFSVFLEVKVSICVAFYAILLAMLDLTM